MKCSKGSFDRGIAADPWTLDYGMVHQGRDGIPEYGETDRKTEACRTDLNAWSQVANDPVSAVWDTGMSGNSGLSPQPCTGDLAPSRDSRTLQ